MLMHCRCCETLNKMKHTSFQSSRKYLALQTIEQAAVGSSSKNLVLEADSKKETLSKNKKRLTNIYSECKKLSQIFTQNLTSPHKHSLFLQQGFTNMNKQAI